jgi:hypothetical protein
VNVQPTVPIPGSSVPGCPCENEKPCVCNRYAHRLEQRLNELNTAHFDALRRMEIAQQAIEALPLSAKQQTALAAVRIALETL